MGREARMTKIRRQIKYKPHQEPGKETRRYDIIPRVRTLYRRKLVDGKMQLVEVGIFQSGQRLCTGARRLYRGMKKVDANLRRQNVQI